MNEHSAKYVLQFKYDSKIPAETTIYISVNEEVNRTKYPFIKISAVDNRSQQFKYQFEGPKNGELFITPSPIFEPEAFDEKRLTVCKFPTSFYPMIIKMQANYPMHSRVQILYTYLKFVLKNGVYSLKPIYQKVVMDTKIYQLYQIFGNDKSSSNKECPICLVNPIDTFTIPCRHLCICVHCAEEIRKKPKKICPICRAVISKFISIRSKKI